MTPTDLQAYVERSRTVVEESPDLSLRNTQLRLVQPLLSVLGWDPLTEVEAEVPVDEETTVDYALSTDAGVQVVVETVACGEDLTADHGTRLERAMAAAGVDWGVLSNGRTFVFVTREGGDLEHRRCSLPDLPDNGQVLELFTREAAAARATPDAAERRAAAAADLAADREAAATAVHEALADHVDADVDDDLATAADAFVAATVAALRHDHHPAEAVRTPAEDAVGDAGDVPTSDPTEAEDSPTAAGDSHPDAAGDTVGPDESDDATDGDGDAPAPDTVSDADAAATPDQGADASPDQDADAPSDEDTDADAAADAGDQPDVLAEAADRVGVSRNSRPSRGDASEGAASEDDPADRHRDPPDAPMSRNDDGYVVRFFDGRTRIGAVGHSTPGTALAGAIEFLFDQRSLAGGLSVPWPQESDRALLNHGPVHPDGSEMADHAQLSNGYYLCTAVDASTARGALEDLASKAGLRVLFQGDW